MIQVRRNSDSSNFNSNVDIGSRSFKRTPPGSKSMTLTSFNLLNLVQSLIFVFQRDAASNIETTDVAIQK